MTETEKPSDAAIAASVIAYLDKYRDELAGTALNAELRLKYTVPAQEAHHG